MADLGLKTILVVDDQEVVCTAMADLLRLDGHDVETSHTPGAAIDLCNRRHFDLIFLDYYLPEMTGEQVVRLLRQTNPKLPIVLMSGQRPYPPIGEADSFIPKPFRRDVIEDAVARFA
jgi:CheY-like chemotaxis protein